MVKYNNHKKAHNNLDIVIDTIEKEIIKGWVLKLPVDIIPHLPNAMVCLMGMAEQTNYHLDGTTTTKNRLTHDQTFHILETTANLPMA
jgi:hypothetical protein